MTRNRFIDVKNGVIHTNVGDLANFLNEGISNSPLKKIKLSGDGDQLKLKGTLHKVIPLSIEVISTIGVAPDNRIQIHVTKINLLKIPFKKLLAGFNVTAASLFPSADIPGVEVKDRLAR
jgi:UDP-N-acetylglucosamine enolpyruvyl transferase